MEKLHCSQLYLLLMMDEPGVDGMTNGSQSHDTIPADEAGNAVADLRTLSGRGRQVLWNSNYQHSICRPVFQASVALYSLACKRARAKLTQEYCNLGRRRT